MNIENTDHQAICEIKRLCVKFGISISELSMHIQVTPCRIFEILSGKRRITADSDLRLSRFFGQKKRHFIDMQIDYDMLWAEDRLKDKLAKIEPINNKVRK